MKTKICLVAFACLSIQGIACGQTLFSENWSTGSIDPSKWLVRGPTANAIALELPVESSDGDFALTLRGTQDPDFPGTVQTWLDNIMSVTQFSRIDQVTMEFKAWNKPGSNAQIGVHGGFHHISVSQTQQHYAQDLLNTPEATFDYVVNDIRASESGDYIQGGPSFFEATQAIKANTKNGAATFRVTLDSVQGALWEIIVPVANPAHSTGEGDPEIYVGRDTRGIPNYGEQTGLPGTVINDQIMNAIGFGLGAGMAGTSFIDDILVYGPNGPTSPVLAGDYNENGFVDAADYTVWRDNLDSTNELPNDLIGGTIRQDQYNQWKANFGAVAEGSGSGALMSTIVPEPATGLLTIFAILLLPRFRRRH